MGAQDKLQLPYQGQSLLAHMITQLQLAQIDELILVRQSHSPLLSLPSKVKTILNPNAAQGMTSSIQAGIQAASLQSKGFLICLADMPLLSPQEYNQIIQAFQQNFSQNNKAIIVPFFNHQKGNPVLFSSEYKSALLAHQAPNGCRAIIQENKKEVIKIEMENDHILVDIDTPEAWQAIQKRINPQY